MTSRYRGLLGKTVSAGLRNQHARGVRYPETRCRRQAADDCRLAACAPQKRVRAWVICEGVRGIERLLRNARKN